MSNPYRECPEINVDLVKDEDVEYTEVELDEEA